VRKTKSEKLKEKSEKLKVRSEMRNVKGIGKGRSRFAGEIEIILRHSQ
jgi:hypothetical protein